MTILMVEPTDQEERLHRACDVIATRAPELSAQTFVSRGQRRALIVLAIAVAVGIAISPRWTATFGVAVAIAAYVVTVTQRVLLTRRSLSTKTVVTVSDSEARALRHHELPVYTVLVPMYREAAVVEQLIEHLRAIEYPTDLLEVILLVEEDDNETFDAVVEHARNDFTVVTVPAGEPRTKPRALNYGLTFATGEFVTIYDAEDRPDPLQLRRAVVAFQRMPDDLACLQAQLAFWNVDQNLLTRLFEVEYRQCFELVLPALSSKGAPVPLGGTSNHIRRSALDDVGAWDPYNVTEDADLGVRLHRAGYQCLVLESTTLEEANSDYVNWNKQRSRWYKGYLQTWLVHMRRPARLVDDLGWRGFFDFNLFVAGAPILALLNLVFWAMTLAWFVGQFAFIQAIFPAAVYYPALVCFIFGNFVMAYLFVLAARTTGRPQLVYAALLVPLYWVCMSVAAVKAFYQLVVDRSFWEKTVHGLAPDGASSSVDVDVDLTESGDAGGALDGSARLMTTTVAPVARDEPAILRWIDVEATAELPRKDRRRIVGRALLGVVAALVGFVLYVSVLSAPLSRPVSGHIVSPVPNVPAAGTCVARLSAPRVGLAETVCEGVATNVVSHALGHVPGTPLPGQAGDAVLVAHRNAYEGAGDAVAKLRVGDTVDVAIGGATVQYQITSKSEQSRAALRFDNGGHPSLVLVTGASIFDPSRVVVLEGGAMATPTTRFTGTHLAERGTVRLPGTDGGQFVAVLGCLLFAAIVFASRRKFAELTDAPWLAGCLVAISIASVFAAIVFAARALPPTF